MGRPDLGNTSVRPSLCPKMIVVDVFFGRPFNVQCTNVYDYNRIACAHGIFNTVS